MDSHITHLEPETLFDRSARLPDEPDLGSAPDPLNDPAPAPTPEVSTPVRLPKRRGRLLAGVSAGALVIVAGGGFLLSPFNTIVPVPSSVTAFAAQAGQSLAGLPTSIAYLADEAKQAVMGSPAQTGQTAAEPGAQPAETSRAQATKPASVTPADPIVAPAASLAATHVPRRPNSITAPAYSSQPRDQNLNELLKLRGDHEAPASDAQQSPPTSAPVVASAKPSVTQPLTSATSALPPGDIQEPGSSASPALNETTQPQQADVTLSVTQAALGQSARPTSSPAVTSPAPVATNKPSGPADPAPIENRPVPAVSQAVAAPDIKAEPASTKAPVLVLSVPSGSQEQAEVLQYVTGLSSEIARLRTENDTLRKDIVRRLADQDSRMGDFNRRVSVAEARAALRSAADAGKAEPTPAEPVARPASAPIVAPPLQVAAFRSAPPPAAARARYRVQAASPGLALLAEVGRGGGDGAQLQVAVGDQVPGYGVVKSVAQKGPNWVVLTEHGQID